jgi:pyrroline-5-carboxylate reductase
VASENAGDEFRTLAGKLSDAAGDFLWVADEEALDRLTAISGCGSGYAFQMIESFERAARSLGFDDAEARMLVRQTMAGAAEMALQSEDSAESMKQAVMSKRGVTEAGVAQMTADDIMDNLMLAVVNAAYDRAREMAAGSD